MTLRARIFTALLNSVRKISREFGCEIVVETSPHSIKTKLEVPNKDRRAWDSNLYKHGQLFHAKYANPIKPKVEKHQELEAPDEIDIEESDTLASDDSAAAEDNPDDSPHVTLISSGRYRSYMRQHLVSELLTPREQWKLIAYGILAIGFLQMASLIILLFTNGTF